MNDRIIKFRAWNIQTKTMIDLQACTQLVTDLGGLYLPTNDDNVIIQQFTGLSDKNGKDIYEDDIISYKFTDMAKRDREYRGPVVYSPPYFHINLIRWFDGVEETGSPLWFERLGRAKWDLEIIGNIHENPELLNN